MFVTKRYRAMKSTNSAVVYRLCIDTHPFHFYAQLLLWFSQIIVHFYHEESCVIVIFIREARRSIDQLTFRYLLVPTTYLYITSIYFSRPLCNFDYLSIIMTIISEWLSSSTRIIILTKHAILLFNNSLINFLAPNPTIALSVFVKTLQLLGRIKRTVNVLCLKSIILGNKKLFSFRSAFRLSDQELDEVNIIV